MIIIDTRRHTYFPSAYVSGRRRRARKKECAHELKKVYIHRVYEFQYPVHKTEPTREVFCQHITIVVGEFM